MVEIALALGALACAGALGSHLALRAALRRVGEVPKEALERLRQVEEGALAHRASIEGLIETAEDWFERLERKRRSAAGTLSKLEEKNGQQQLPQTRAEVLAAVRQKVGIFT